MSAQRLADRLSQLGSVGSSLRKHLGQGDDQVVAMSTRDQFVYVDKLCVKDSLRAGAVSILLANYPRQVQLTDTQLLRLVELDRFDQEMRESGVYVLFKGGRDQLPLKQHPGATNKVNLYFSNVFKGVSKQQPHLAAAVRKRQYLFRGLYNDTASALLMYAALTADVIEDSLGFAAYLVHRPQDAKALSTVVKSLGCNGSLLGACLCECNVLQGRSTGVCTFEEEAAYRLDPSAVSSKLARPDLRKLRLAVREIIQEELPADVVFPGLDEHWEKRWLWCVNGAHSNVLARLEEQWKVPFKRRMHRKVFAENIAFNPIPAWSGTAYFVMSLKLELGKTRAIFGGDTVTYFAFDHLLSSIENRWRGKTVLLDPGRGGTTGVVDRVRRMKRQRAWSIMLDYDDFNSQHSNAAKAIVIDELARHTGYPTDLAEKLVRSVFNEFVVEDGVPKQLFGTLMSGHRATTMINSVLNRAYLLVEVPSVRKCEAVHVGDDILLTTNDDSVAADVMDEVAISTLRMNPIKQSVGCVVSEFLRTVVTPKYARGYLARSIGSVIAGNWVSDRKLGPREFLVSAIGSAWTMKNRCQKDVGYLLEYDLNRVTNIRLDLCRKFLDGYASVDGSPVRGASNKVAVYRVTEVNDDHFEDITEVVRRYEGRTLASEDYLSKAATPVERHALGLAGGDIKDIMVRSSYTKTLISQDVIVERNLRLELLYEQTRPYTSMSYEQCLENARTCRARGSLISYPLISLIKDRLSRYDVIECLRIIGDTRVGDPFELAFGEKERQLAVISGAIPFADASTYGRYCDGALVRVTYDIFT